MSLPIVYRSPENPNVAAAKRTMGTTETSATLNMGRAWRVVRAAIFRRGGIAIHGGDERRQRCRRVGARWWICCGTDHDQAVSRTEAAISVCSSTVLERKLLKIKIPALSRKQRAR